MPSFGIIGGRSRSQIGRLHKGAIEDVDTGWSLPISGTGAAQIVHNPR
jgi:hypothetical protein